MIDFDRDYRKHCVRYYGWLPACKAHSKRIGNRVPSYFTLCATQAIDVFMLESEGILRRDKKTDRLPGVVICEKDGEAAAEIFNLVRPPLKEAIIVGALEDILTFEDTAETRSLSPNEDVRDSRVRRLLRLKGLSQTLRSHFPFDIVNFDPYGNLFHPDPSNNKLHQAFRRVFDLQKGINAFLLLVTTPVHHIHPLVANGLKECFESNVARYDEVREALEATLGTSAYRRIGPDKKAALDVAKGLVISAARESKWEHEHQGVFVYKSPGGHKMLSAVVLVSKPDEEPSMETYIRDVVQIVQHMPTYYSAEGAREDRAARRHLRGVIEYRNKVRQESKQPREK